MSPSPEYVEECKQLQNITRLYFRQSTTIKNELHTLQTRGFKRGKIINSLKRQLKSLQKEIKLLDLEMEQLINVNQQDLYTRFKTIPQRGNKTAILLIVTTNGFKDFENSKQISSYLGLAPNERRSGSSIRGKTRISKTGNSLVRNHLFLCSFTACIHNPQYNALYE